MKKERTIIGVLFLLQLVLWLGFLVHRSPRFPGSLAGSLLAIAGALLMVVPPLLYSAAKRSEFFKRLIKGRVSLGTLLSWHIYTSVAGAILAILHTGHRFESPLGIWLTAMMLLTTLSGFAGRYFLSFSVQELREKKDMLNRLSYEYNRLVAENMSKPDAELVYESTHHPLRRMMNSLFGTESASAGKDTPLPARALRLVESIADLEYAIRSHELLKRRTAQWLKLHIATSVAFYVLLILHIWSAIYFGLRFLR